MASSVPLLFVCSVGVVWDTASQFLLDPTISNAKPKWNIKIKKLTSDSKCWQSKLSLHTNLRSCKKRCLFSWNRFHDFNKFSRTLTIFPKIFLKKKSALRKRRCQLSIHSDNFLQLFFRHWNYLQHEEKHLQVLLQMSTLNGVVNDRTGLMQYRQYIIVFPFDHQYHGSAQ